MAKEHVALLGDGSQQQPTLALGDMSYPIIVTGPTAEVHLGFFGPRDNVPVHFDAVACLGQAPSALAAYVSLSPGSSRDSVKISVWTSAFAAAAASTVTKVHLTAVRGSAVAK